jgi:hypothetical protein
MAIERKRGCGYRKVGGMYLVGDEGIWVPCDRLPIILDVCPACGGGIKPGSFMKEAREIGASKRINAIPKGFVVGETWVILAHRQAGNKDFDEHEFDEKKQNCKFCGIAKNGFDVQAAVKFASPKAVKCTRRLPAIFSAFRPSRIEKLVDDDTPQDEIEKLEKRGITVIKVPKGDKDHHGNVYEDFDEEQKSSKLRELSLPPSPRLSRLNPLSS